MTPRATLAPGLRARRDPGNALPALLALDTAMNGEIWGELAARSASVLQAPAETILRGDPATAAVVEQALRLQGILAAVACGQGPGTPSVGGALRLETLVASLSSAVRAASGERRLAVPVEALWLDTSSGSLLARAPGGRCYVPVERISWSPMLRALATGGPWFMASA